MLNWLKNNSIGKFSLLIAILGALLIIGYTIYGIVFDYLDSVVLIAFILGTVLNLVAALQNEKWKAFNLLGNFAFCVALSIFFLNSFPVWADNLNDIDMYGSRGGLVPVYIIMGTTLLTIVLEIVTCFCKTKNVD